MKRPAHATLALLLALAAEPAANADENTPPASAPAPVPAPEKPESVAPRVLTLDFPELGPMHDQLPSACQVSVPANYDPAVPVPLLVWFGGGRGSHSVDGARGVVDFGRFLVVALPYPQGTGPRNAAEELRVEEFWDYHRAMLARVRELFPNLHPRLRIAAGTSNGAHYIAYGLDQRWPGFGEMFTDFVLHEGGAAPLSSAIPGAKGRRLLVVWGTNSDSASWRRWFNDRISVVGADLKIIAVPGAGHGLNDDARQIIRRWIDALPTNPLVNQ